MPNYSDCVQINLGSGLEIAIKELDALVKDRLGFEGNIIWDTTKPDGTPRKLMDSSKLNVMGWKLTIALKDGVRGVYEEFKQSL